MKSLFSCLTVAGFALAAAAPAQAATETANISASATVTTVCTVSAGPLSFGEMPISGTLDGTATITANCTNGGAYTIALDDGLNADVGQRRLAATAGGHLLNYDLYKELTHTERWGATGEELVDGEGTGVEQELTVYGQVAAGQTLYSGDGSLTYNDTVQVTITY